MKTITYAPPILFATAICVTALMNPDSIPTGIDGVIAGAAIGTVIGLWMTFLTKVVRP